MRSRAATKSAPFVPKPAPPVPKPPRAAPSWLRPLLLGLMGVLVLSMLSGPVGDTDTWWHLASGKYIFQNHRLPVPDPFSFTTDLGTPTYPGELTTRHFNLTHEWGMQLIFYAVLAAGGFGGLVVFRALVLSLFCAIAGWLTARRSGSFYRGLAAAFIAAVLAASFASDRPYLATFLAIALTMVVFETRRSYWLLPPLFLMWANLHGGFIMGWAIAAAYSAEALYLRLRGRPVADERKIWTASALAILATFLNPNGLNIVEVMRHYRESPLQIAILEWNYPAWWPPDRFNLLEAGTAAVLLLFRRKIRMVDWLLFAILGGSAAMALRNVIFIGFIGPILIGTYLPKWKRPVPVILEYGAAAALVALICLRVFTGAGFQLRAADNNYPKEASDFLISHGFRGRVFNTYEQGGYLMWRLWPQGKVFMDGRALNESVYADYRLMVYNADAPGGRTTNDLLRKYDVQAIVLSGFDGSGNIQYLVPALSDPSQKEWKLVYQDDKEFIYMREPPAGVPVLPSINALNGLEQQCNYNFHHGLNKRCALALANMFLVIGDRAHAGGWATVYSRVDPNDPIVRRYMRRLNLPGR